MSERDVVDMISDVREFHERFGVPILDKPQLTTRCGLRMALCGEEHEELITAIYGGDLEATADAIADCLYVLIGTAHEFGIPLEAVWREVHAANMRKIGGATREDGKILKPNGWVAPNIAAALATPAPQPAAPIEDRMRRQVMPGEQPAAQACERCGGRGEIYSHDGEICERCPDCQGGGAR